MNDTRWERWGAASGLGALLVGGAGGALERGWPSPNDPVAVAAFVADHRTAILAQSMLFLLSAGIYLWFVGSLRSFLIRAEAGTGRVSTVMFGAGVAWAGMSMVAQSFQVGIAMAPPHALEPALLWTFAAMFAISNLPLAIMLIATAVVSIRNRAFPSWSGGLSVVAALSQLLLWFGTVVDSGPLAPNGWLTYTLYPVFALWLLPATIVMIKRVGKPVLQTISRDEPSQAWT